MSHTKRSFSEISKEISQGKQEWMIDERETMPRYDTEYNRLPKEIRYTKCF